MLFIPPLFRCPQTGEHGLFAWKNAYSSMGQKSIHHLDWRWHKHLKIGYFSQKIQIFLNRKDSQVTYSALTTATLLPSTPFLTKRFSCLVEGGFDKHSRKSHSLWLYAYGSPLEFSGIHPQPLSFANDDTCLDSPLLFSNCTVQILSRNLLLPSNLR